MENTNQNGTESNNATYPSAPQNNPNSNIQLTKNIKQKFKDTTTLIKTVNIILIVILPSMVALLVIKLLIKNNINSGDHLIGKTEKVPTPDTITCKYTKPAGFNSDLYLYTYKVKQGDTLLSIASKELGDSSRMHEIAIYNRNEYPSLYTWDDVANKFAIKAGWVLKLPTKNIPRSSGFVEGEEGKVISINNNVITGNGRADKKDIQKSLVKMNIRF